MKKLLLIFFVFNLLVHAQGFVCAIGGGSENYSDWSDVPYSWIVQKARNKKIIILSYSSDVTSWLPNYFLSKGATTAYNKAISSRSSADLQSTYDELKTADGIFLRGGDQFQYISLWKGTKTEQALREIFLRGGVIAGTSAGAMVLGELNFTAKNGSTTSHEALNSPVSSLIDIDTSFLPLVPSVLFDTHFIERGRFGRTVASLYKSKQNFNRNIIAVGIDDRTALCIDSLGFGTVYGSGAVAFFIADEMTRMTFPGPAYSIENLLCHQLTANWVFNFNDRTISFIPITAKNFLPAAQYQFPKTNFVLTGSNSIASQLSNNFQTFLSETGNIPLLVITHEGYLQNISSLTSYLATNNYQHSVMTISSALLNEPSAALQLANAGAIIFCGDSLILLSLLNNNANLLGQKFYEKIEVQHIPLFFFGNAGKISSEYFIDNVDTDELASYRGKMKFENGNNIFSEMIFQPRVFEDSDFSENRVSALLYGMMRGRKRLGIYLNGSDMITIDYSQKQIKGKGSLPFMLIDARNTTKVDSSTYRASSSIGVRQVVAMNNLRYSISKNNADIFSLVDGKFITTVKSEENEIHLNNFILHQNYPNPFNAGTVISFQLSAFSNVTLKIYDMLGNEVATLMDNEWKEAGYYNYSLSIINYQLPSGIYFYRLQAGEFIATKKLTVLK